MDLPLAAYGTLRPGCGGQEHLGLQLEDLGPCTLRGRLWLVEEPAIETGETRLVPALYPDEEGTVRAHLLLVPEEVWSTIDQFEGFVPHDPDAAYIREETETLEGQSAWIYRAQNISRSNFLREGDWTQYASHPRAIPLFPVAKS